MSASAQQQSAPRPKRAAWRVVTVFVGLAAVSIGMAALAPTASANPSKGGDGDTVTKVYICHADSNAKKPYGPKKTDVSVNSIIGDNGHASHTGPVFPGQNWGDIIPPFKYKDGKQVKSYPGLNWTDEGEAIWDNDCRVGASVKVNKVWVIDGVTYYVPTPKHGSSLPRGYSSSLTLTDTRNADWGKEYSGYQKGDSVTIGENATVPDGCTDTVTGDTGPKTLSLGRNTFTVTNTVTCNVNVDVTLTKTWVRAPEGSSDAVSLTIGAAGAIAGSSVVGGNTTSATATVLQGATVTLTEAYTNEDPGEYTSTLQCQVANGTPQSVTVTNLSGTFTIPSNATGTVACTFVNTNTDESSTVNLTKEWEGADDGDSVMITVTNNDTETVGSATVNAEDEKSGTASVSVLPKETFTLSESGDNVDHYEATYECSVGEETLAGDGPAFTVPEGLEPGSTIDCTITNTHKPSTTVTVTKKWVTPDGDFEVPGDGEGPEWQTNYDAQLQIDGQDADWGEPVEVITDDFSAGDISEDPVTVPAGCKATPSIEKVERTETYRSQSVRNVDYVQYVVTNTVTCTPPDSSSNPSSPSSSQQTTTPAETTTEVVETAPVTTESPEVLGASEETTTAEVLGVSSVVAAPSANAHTGQSTSGWAYLLLAAGVAMMLGAGIRKRRRA